MPNQVLIFVLILSHALAHIHETGNSHSEPFSIPSLNLVSLTNNNSATFLEMVVESLQAETLKAHDKIQQMKSTVGSIMATLKEHRRKPARTENILIARVPREQRFKNYPTAQELAYGHSGAVWAFEIRNDADITINYQESSSFGVGKDVNRKFVIKPFTGQAVWYPVEIPGKSSIKTRLRLSPPGWDLIYGVHWPNQFSFGMSFIESWEQMPDFGEFTNPDQNHVDDINDIVVREGGFTATARVEDRDYKLVVVITITSDYDRESR